MISIIIIISKTRNFPMTQNAPALNTFDTVALMSNHTSLKVFLSCVLLNVKSNLVKQRVIMY